MVKALAMAIALVLLAQPAAAFTDMAIPYVTTDSTVFVEPFQYADLTITEFNQTQYTEDHLGDLEITGPSFSGIQASDQSGMLNPILPSLTQNIADNFTYDRTYLFTDGANRTDMWSHHC